MTKAYYPQKIMADYLRDPRVTRAQKMIDEGSSTAPVVSPLQGLARMAQAGIGAYTLGKANGEYDNRASKYTTDMAAMADRLRSSNYPYQDAMQAAAESGNPDVMGNMEDYISGMANERSTDRRMQQQMDMQQRLFDQQQRMSDATLNRQIEFEKWKTQNDPSSALMAKLLRDMQPQGGSPAPQSPPNAGGMSSGASSPPASGNPMAAPAPAVDPRSAIVNALLSKQIGSAPQGMMWNMQNGALGTAALPASVRTGSPALTAKPPVGYRYTEDGSSLEPIPGGPGEKMTEEAAGKQALLQSGIANFGNIRKTFGDDFNNLGDAPSFYGSMGNIGEGKRQVTQLIEAALRVMSGAAVPQTEVDRYTTLFMPTPLDTAETRTSKLNELEKFVNQAAQNIQKGRGDTAPTNSDNPAGAASDWQTTPDGLKYRVVQ